MASSSPRWLRRCMTSALQWSAWSVVEDVRSPETVDVGWLRFLRIGLSVFGLESMVVVGYALLHSPELHQTALLVIAGIGVPLSLVPLAFAPRIIRAPWRATFTFVWTLLGSALLAACAALDGGVESPMLGLAVLPVLYAAVAMPFFAVVVCAGSVLLELVGVIATDTDFGAETSSVVLTCGLVAGALTLALAVARTRVDLERRDAALVHELIQQADTDALTGCASPRVFQRAFAAELSRAQRGSQPLSLAIVDVDLLKSINDGHGHPAGDAVLAHVGSRLRETCRLGDVAARIGGDEFAIILPGADARAAAEIAQRIAEEVRLSSPYDASLSIGIAELGSAAATTTQLFRAADEALYMAKARGRGRVEVAHTGLADASASFLAADDHKRLVEQLQERRGWERRESQLMHAAVAALAAMVERRDPFTSGHQRGVARIAKCIAEEMGLDAFSVEGIELAASVHDIGKIAVPAEIIARPGELTSVERHMMQGHSAEGGAILADVEFPWPIQDMVRQHHERLDGSGYPEGLKGEDIVLGARIIAVADVLEAMGSHRPYRPSKGIEAAAAEIERGSGRLFDPDVVAASLRIIRDGRLPLESPAGAEGAGAVSVDLVPRQPVPEEVASRRP